jgi:hypothetical protein
VTPLARYGAARAIAVAILALAVGLITGLEIVTTIGTDAPRPSTEAAAALLSNDAIHGTETVGVQPPRTPTVGRSSDVAKSRSVVLAVAALAAGVACGGSCLWWCRRADDELPPRGPQAWAGPGGRRAPPLVPAG